ncbi:MAG: DUF72 domain-containing protein [bacterium]
MRTVRTRVLIGTSGFSYRHWADDVFYPSDIPQRQWLEYYSEHFPTVELNVSFYRLPTEKTFKGWLLKTPEDFTFALKGSRFITHVKKLTDCQEPLHIFFERVKILRGRCEVVLWQLPPGFKVDIERLRSFVRMLRKFRKVRHAFEFRNRTWFCDEVYSILGEQGHTVCGADWPGLKVEPPEDFSFIYIRRHGPGRLSGSSYSDEQLKTEAKKIRKWLGKKERVYVYFNNDFGGYAVRNAKALMDMVS